jgi:hypothetical protein
MTSQTVLLVHHVTGKCHFHRIHSHHINLCNWSDTFLNFGLRDFRRFIRDMAIIDTHH